MMAELPQIRKEKTMYNYQTQRAKIFTEKGQTDFMKVRDNVHNLLSMAGAVNMIKAINPISGDGWLMMAYVDRLVELGEIREITSNCAGQDRVFVGITQC